jgi:ectoine hydroxylase-related dioxygenase (phytanoyl-CoA dioxygenase family)
LTPGDVSIHHCLTLHGSDANRGESARKTVVTHLSGGSCRLVRERLPATALAYFATDADGRLTDESFPALFRRAAAPEGK